MTVIILVSQVRMGLCYSFKIKGFCDLSNSRYLVVTPHLLCTDGISILIADSASFSILVM